MPRERVKWRDLYDDLRKGIVSGRYPIDSALPSVPTLMRERGLSNSTVVQALQQLGRDGYVEARHGSGHWVVRAEPAATTESRLAALEDDVAALKRHLGID